MDVSRWQTSLGTLGTSICHVGSSLASSLSSLAVDSTDREKVSFVTFSHLEYTSSKPNSSGLIRRPVLLIGYTTGFQVWDLGSGAPNVLVSRREGPVRFCSALPEPQKRDAPGSPLHGLRPCLAIVPVDSAPESPGRPQPASQRGVESACELESAGPSGVVQVYTLRTHSVVQTLRFSSRVLSVRASCRLLIVALDAQVMAFDANMLQRVFSVVTYPAPCTRQLLDGERPAPGTAVPLALGPRWLAYASNQALSGSTSPQSLVPASQRLPSGLRYDSVSGYAKAAAVTGGKQLLGLGEAGYKYMSSQYGQWRSGSWEGASTRDSPREEASVQSDSDVVGTVMVRDVVSRAVVAHFRAHTAPLLVLQWDASGTLLVTASVHGHNVNVFQVAPGKVGSNGERLPGRAVHLLRLLRGLTPAVIQDVAFSACGTLLTVSSARGTTHIYRLALPGALSGTAPPHLAAGQQAASSGQAPPKAARLGAVGRVRHMGLLNGVIPGSSAAAAAVSLYNGNAGADCIAAALLPRRQPSSSRADSGSPAEDLYIVHGDGRLLRHRLHAMPASSEVQADDGAAGSSFGSTPDTVLSASEESQGEVGLEAEEQWDLCRRASWAEREEELVEASSGGQGTAQGRDERAVWMAHAETSVASPVRSALWSDNQFHILEMQTGAAPSHQPARAAAHASESKAADYSTMRLEAVPTRRVNTMRAPASPVTTDAAGMAVVCQPLRVPKALRS